MSSYQPTDILCGRGKHTFNHFGNKYFRKLIKLNKVIESRVNKGNISLNLNTFQEIYISSKRSEKIFVAKSIVQEIQNQSPAGRFIEYNIKEKQWKEISNERAVEKTCQALREKINKNKSHKTFRGIKTLSTIDLKEFDQEDFVTEKARKVNLIVEQNINQFDFIQYSSPLMKEKLKACMLLESSLNESCKEFGINEHDLDQFIYDALVRK